MSAAGWPWATMITTAEWTLPSTTAATPPRLLHNENAGRRIIGFAWKLEGSRHRDPEGSNRDAIGAKVTLKAGGRTLVRYLKRAGGSYYSCHEKRLLIGLGPAEQVESVEIRWPNRRGTVQQFGPLQADRSYRIVEGGAGPPSRRDARRCGRAACRPKSDGKNRQATVQS